MVFLLDILVFRSYSYFNSCLNVYEEPVLLIIVTIKYSLDLFPCLNKYPYINLTRISLNIFLGFSLISISLL